MIETIRLINLATNEILVVTTGEECMLIESTEYAHTRELQSVAMSKWAYTQDSNKFIPQSLTLDFKKRDLMEKIKQKIRSFNAVLLLEVTKKTAEKMSALVMVESDVISFLGQHSIQTMSVTLMRTSMWFKQIEIFHNVDNERDTINKYNYQYPIKYTGDNNGDFDMSKLKLYNNGDTIGTVDVKIIGTASQPIIKCGKEMYKAIDVELDVSGMIEIKNSPKDIGIYSSIPEIEMKRDFGEKTFLDVPQGEFYLEFMKISKAEVVLYEYYYNL